MDLPSSIKWPAKGFQEMLPDIKLLIWEHAATSIAVGAGKMVQDCHNLLNRFAMLALLVTKYPSSYNMAHKDRQYTQAAIKSVHDGRESLFATMEIMNSLKSAQKPDSIVGGYHIQAFW